MEMVGDDVAVDDKTFFKFHESVTENLISEFERRFENADSTVQHDAGYTSTQSCR